MIKKILEKNFLLFCTALSMPLSVPVYYLAKNTEEVARDMFDFYNYPVLSVVINFTIIVLLMTFVISFLIMGFFDSEPEGEQV